MHGLGWQDGVGQIGPRAEDRGRSWDVESSRGQAPTGAPRGERGEWGSGVFVRRVPSEALLRGGQCARRVSRQLRSERVGEFGAEVAHRRRRRRHR